MSFCPCSQVEEVDGGRGQEEEEELLEELGYKAQSDSILLRDRILLHLSFSLGKGSFTVVTSSSSSSSPPSWLGPEPLVGLEFSSLCCSLDLRPRVRYVSFDLSLGGLFVEDHVDPQSLFPVLVKPKGAEVRREGGREGRREGERGGGREGERGGGREGGRGRREGGREDGAGREMR